MIRSLDRKSNWPRRSVIRFWVVLALLVASVLTFTIVSRSVDAGSSLSPSAGRAERKNHRISMRPEVAFAPPALPTPFFATITVDRTDDVAGASACTAAANDCSLRGAIAFANLSPGTTINVPAGNYNLTISGAGEGFSGNNSVGDLDVTGNNTSIVGAGASATIITQTTAGDR